MTSQDESSERIRERLRQRRTPLGSSRAHNASDPAATSDHTTVPASVLDQMESNYIARLRDVRLIGELDLTREEFESLSEALRSLRFQPETVSHLRRMTREYPASTVVFLVYAGIYEYEAGDYWNGPAMSLRLTPTTQADTTMLGRLFEAFVLQNRLEPFSGFEGHALRYVSRILAHGGIPNYCLPDFFNLLDYTLRRDEWSSLPPQLLVEEWRARQYSFIQIDTPVRRFLDHGGATAHDFLQRALDMAALVIRTGTPPPADGTGLPDRIVERFAEWFEDSKQTRVVSPIGSGRRLAPPRIVFDPWARDGLAAELPQQAVEQAASHAEWLIQAGGTQSTIAAKIARARTGDTVIQSETFQLRSPAASYGFALRIDGRDRATWIFRGITRDRPVMAFEPDTGVLVPWVGQLPDRDLWMITSGQPPSATSPTSATPSACLLEEFPDLVAGWRGFRAFHVDLHDCQAIVVPDSGPAGSGRSIPVKPADTARRPMLHTESHMVRGVTANDNRAAVLREAPSISIPPAVSEDVFRAELWSLALTPLRGAVPNHVIVVNVSNLVWSTAAAGEATLSLRQENLLPSNAFGPFSLSVRGPLGQDAAFEFVLLPGLDIRGRENPLRLGDLSSQSVTMKLSMISPIHIASADAATSVREVASGYEVMTQSTESLLLFTPRHDHPLGVGDGTPVELAISTPILRWALLGVGSGQAIEWFNRSITISHAEVEA